MPRWGAIAVFGLAALVAARSALAQPPALADNGWQLEQLVLVDGRVLEGMLLSNRPTGAEFMEIHRPLGKPIYLVVRPVEAAKIKEIRRIDERQRRQLEERVRRIRNRAFIEAMQQQSVGLEPEDEGSPWGSYQGQWFRVRTTLPEPAARLLIVRLEQMFIAFRQVLPPKRTPSVERPLEFRLYGSSAAYFSDLVVQRIAIRNPAFFDAQRNLVAVGTDLGRLTDDVLAAEAAHKELLETQKRRTAQWVAARDQLSKALEEQKTSKEERRTILAAATARFTKEQQELEEKIKTAALHNQNFLRELEQRTLVRLYHEAFHAYLENYVYPSAVHPAPRWLNEGLAQIFEAGQLEAGTLRVDAPTEDALVRLQAELRGGAPLSLAQVLTAEPNVFLVPHRSNSQASDRYYLYSWGLAYYLTFRLNVLGTPALDEYVRTEAADPPVARFEKLIGQPLAEFETRWRAHLLELRPGVRP